MPLKCIYTYVSYLADIKTVFHCHDGQVGTADQHRFLPITFNIEMRHILMWEKGSIKYAKNKIDEMNINNLHIAARIIAENGQLPARRR